MRDFTVAIFKYSIKYLNNRQGASAPCPVLTVRAAELSEIRAGQAAHGGGKRQGDPGEQGKAEEPGGARRAAREAKKGQ